MTRFEIFFDLVFVFALTRIMAFVGQPPTPAGMVRGLLLLVLLWFTWSSYAWLGSHTWADVGAVRVGVLVAMAALFVAALAMPQAWTPRPGLDGPLLLALAYLVLSAVHLALYHWVAASSPGLQARIRLFAVPNVVSWVPFVAGALVGGSAQLALWVVAYLINIAGQRLAYGVRGGWPLHGARHFTERHGLVLIIALGESLVAAGIGAGAAVTVPPVLGVALTALAVTVCLWWLYFDRAAPAGSRALAEATGDRRERIASDAYSQSHLALVAGVICLALGVEQVLTRVAEPYGHHGDDPSLSWTGAVALYGGAALYLGGRLLFVRLTGQAVRPGQVAFCGAALALLPLGRALSAGAALGVVAVLLVGAAVHERLFRAA